MMSTKMKGEKNVFLGLSVVSRQSYGTALIIVSLVPRPHLFGLGTRHGSAAYALLKRVRTVKHSKLFCLLDASTMLIRRPKDD